MFLNYFDHTPTVLVVIFHLFMLLKALFRSHKRWLIKLTIFELFSYLILFLEAYCNVIIAYIVICLLKFINFCLFKSLTAWSKHCTRQTLYPYFFQLKLSLSFLAFLPEQWILLLNSFFFLLRRIESRNFRSKRWLLFFLNFLRTWAL